MQYVMLVYLSEKEFYALSKDEQNRVHRECTAFLFASGFIVFLMWLLPGAGNGPTASETKSLLGMLMAVFFIGIIAAPWIANILITRRPTR